MLPIKNRKGATAPMANRQPIGKPVLRQVKTPCGVLTYQFTPKRVKNINLRVLSDGSLLVSAAPRVPIREVERLLISRSQWITEAMERAAARRQQSAARDTLPLWGREIPLYVHTVSSDQPEGLILDGEGAVMSLWEDVPQRRQAQLLLFWAREAKEIFVSRFRFWADWFQRRYPVEAGKVRLAVKPMTSRWGSYSKRTGSIALSLYLAAKPPEFLEYTIVHEFCHMIYLDHSPAFHALVEENLPGASEIRGRMKESPIR